MLKVFNSVVPNLNFVAVQLVLRVDTLQYDVGKMYIQLLNGFIITLVRQLQMAQHLPKKHPQNKERCQPRDVVRC